VSKKYSLAGVLVMAMAAVAWACPPESESSTVKKEGCQGKAQTVADKDGKEGCDKAKAQTVADKDGKGDCQKGDAKTVADKEGCCKKGAQTVAEKSGKASGCCKSGKSAALVAEVMKSLPHMTYKVADESTPCPDAAAALVAKTEGAKIEYVVGEDTFCSKDQAQARLATLLDKATTGLLEVGYSVDGECVKCPHAAQGIAAEKKSTVKYRVAGVDFSSKEHAEKAIAKAREALTQVTATRTVGDKTEAVKCWDEIKCGEKATYTVAGNETQCPIEAKLMLAEAKIRVIVETAANTAS